MVKRRSIGPAFERSPAERFGDWSSRNVLILVAAIIVAIIFWFICNWLVDGLFNFLATGGDDNKVKPFNSDTPMWVAVKIIGSMLCIFFICKRRAK